MARINLVLPDEQMEQVQAVAKDRKEAITDTLRRYVRMGGSPPRLWGIP